MWFIIAAFVCLLLIICVTLICFCQRSTRDVWDHISGNTLLSSFSMNKDVLIGKTEDVLNSLSKGNNTPKYVITHNSDICISNDTILQYDSVKLWFGQNVISKNSKLIALPIGFANKMWIHGDVSIIEKIANENILATKLCYLNISMTSKERQLVKTTFEKKPWLTFENNVSFETYLRHLKQHKFVLSPPGNGPDCHRTWEALTMGTIPIVEKSQHSLLLFEDLPVIMVDRWEEVTPEFLKNRYTPFDPKKLKKLKLSYWVKMIEDHLKL